jgi:inner membrane transporter RhtA
VTAPPGRTRSVRALSSYFDAAAPEPLFVLSAIAQYTGATIAMLLFDEVAPRTVAWLRVASAAAVLILVSPGALHRWTRPQLLAAAVFGIATALMNTFFFMGLARTDLGKSVAIEFIGPIAVAAAMTRTARNAGALLLAACGVVVLGGLEVGDNTIGLLWILAASAMWALYIVIGSRIAQLGRGVAGLGIGLAIGAVAITPIGAPGSADVFTTPRLLVGCVLVGVFSNAIGYGIDQHVLRRIPVRRFSVLLALLPVTAVVFGWIGLDQVPSPVEFAGIALVLAGVVLQERDEIPHPAAGEAP